MVITGKLEQETTPTRSRKIAGDLARRIVDGEFPVGSRLPTERELAARFGTTRNVIREALRRLETGGLVQIRRGSGVYADNPQLTAGVEFFDVLMGIEDGSLNAAFLRDVLEFRGHIFRMMVRLAALRRTDAELARFGGLVAERRDAAADPALENEVTLQIFREIARATHNQICQMLFNSVERVTRRLRALVDLPTVSFEQTQKIFERLEEAFRQRDPALAEITVIRHVDATFRAFGLGRAAGSDVLFAPEPTEGLEEGA
ncbi:MAG: FadR family transcriptional regulator [Candidatus Hydrogenedentes bacterium]|nr:FadR family transcriptional regulator [Candidatus Hydrogenedentota bacterium]